MQDLRLIGVHEDGQHLLLAGEDGARFRVPLDEPLRAAARRDRPRLGQLQIEIEGGLRPREVQAMIRAGAGTEEVAERSGWTVEKVHKYEGPILDERRHVAQLARAVRVRARGGSGGSAPTLAARVAQRMARRGVDPATGEWDAWRREGSPWTVVLTFAAGGRQRQASWVFDPAARTVAPNDDEARWLSEDEPVSGGPVPTSSMAGPARPAAVYDVEAEGGLAAAAPGSRRHTEEPLDLMTAMRERSAARARRTGSRRRPAPTEVPGASSRPPDSLPLEDLAFDPEVDPPPPGARVHPDDDPDMGAAPPDPAGMPASAEPPAGTGAPRPAAKFTDKGRKGRTSVPSWDDIMFGARPRA